MLTGTNPEASAFFTKTHFAPIRLEARDIYTCTDDGVVSASTSTTIMCVQMLTTAVWISETTRGLYLLAVLPASSCSEGFHCGVHARLFESTDRGVPRSIYPDPSGDARKPVRPPTLLLTLVFVSGTSQYYVLDNRNVTITWLSGPFPLCLT